MQLEIKKVNKNYGELNVLSDVTITLKTGIYGLLGPNGAGKSTFLGILTNNVKQDGGEIYYNGNQIDKMGKDYRKRIGYMPQQQICYPEMTLYDFLEYMAVLKEIPKKNRKEEIIETIDKVNLSHVVNKKLKKFSGGMLRRAILAQALLGKPEILILDEPTAGLDPGERIVLRNMVAELSEEMIVILATHIVSDIESIADQVILLRSGEVIAMDSPERLIESVYGKIGSIMIGRNELSKLPENLRAGNVIQKKQGLEVHVVSETLSEDVKKITDITLEDVFLYYFR